MLSRAAAYVEQFERQLSDIVAEEAYEQTVRRLAPSPVTIERRHLRSDLLLMPPAEGVSWVQFRDVFEVDGRPIRGRRERLDALFLQSPSSRMQQAGRIRRESARYNIGSIERTMNVPVLPLSVLAQDARDRFAFTVEAPSSAADRAVRDLPDTPSFRVSTEVWAVAFRERKGPTLVRTPGNGDIYSRGRLWIEPATGRVLMGEIIAEASGVRGQVTVSFQSEPLLGFLVPVEMHERYERGRDPRVIDGTAIYGRFRQFRVLVEQQIAPPR